MRTATDLIGRKFGRLTVVSRAPNSRTRVMWKCLCDCGNEAVVRSSSLLSGKSQSCGCLHKESIRRIQEEYHIKHGDAVHGGRERIYNTWLNMRKRCENEKDKSYKNYGGRGIRICKEWHDYLNFKKWAVENGYDSQSPSFEMTLDRIDVNGNYEPSNCRWVNSKVQNNNRRNNRRITYNGETLTISQWAEKIGISEKGLKYRLENWTIKKALETPPHKKCVQ